MIEGAEAYYRLTNKRGAENEFVLPVCFVEEIHWFEDRTVISEHETPQMTLTIVHELPNDQRIRLRFLFKGVSGLQVRDFSVIGPQKSQLGSLAIYDFSDKGWEHARWEICDYEQDRMRFFSHTAKLESASAEAQTL